MPLIEGSGPWIHCKNMKVVTLTPCFDFVLITGIYMPGIRTTLNATAFILEVVDMTFDAYL